MFLEHSFAQLSLLLVRTTIGTHSSGLNHPAFSLHPAGTCSSDEYLKRRLSTCLEPGRNGSNLHISKFQFAHLFKEVVGVSPYSWLQLYRIIRSQDLLLHTRRTITDIAISCGFSSIAVYNQLFKRLYGFSPSIFRKSYSNQIEE